MTPNDHEAGKVSDERLAEIIQAGFRETDSHATAAEQIFMAAELRARRAESQTGAVRVRALSVSDAVSQLTNAVEAEKQHNAVRNEMLATVIVNLEKSEMTAEFATLLRDYVRAERSKLSALARRPRYR